MKKRAILYTENMENLLSLAEFLVSDNWEIISADETAEFLGSKNIPVTVEKSLLNSSYENDAHLRLLHQIDQTENKYSYDGLESAGEVKLV